MKSLKDPSWLIDRIPGTGTYEWHPVEDKLYWSQNLITMYGLDKAPSTEEGFIKRVHPQDRVRVEAETAHFIEHGAEYAHEFRIVLPNGDTKYVHDRGSIIRGDDGKIVLMQGINFDITAQRTAGGERLAESERRFSAMVAMLPTAVFVCDRAGRITHFNRKAAILWGREPELNSGADLYCGAHRLYDGNGKPIEPSESFMAKTLKAGATFANCEAVIERPDGVKRDVSVSTQPIASATGKVVSAIGVLHDISDRKEAETIVKASEDWLSSVLETVPQMVWSATPDGFADFCNRRWHDFVGSSPENAVGLTWLDLIHRDDRPHAWDAWQNALENRTTYETEFRLRHHAGGHRWVLALGTPVIDDDGNVVRCTGTCTDIHDLKQAREGRKLLIRELNHRVKNTLSIIQALANQTFRKVDGAEAATASFQARLAALDAATNLLTGTDWEVAAIRDIIRTAVEETLSRPGALEVDGPDADLSPRQAVALTLALHELGTNSLKYGALSSDSGTVRISWQLQPEAEGTVDLVWQESGGPPVTPPTETGFGTLMIRKALAGDDNGSVRIDYRPDGLVCHIRGRLREVAEE